MDRKDWLLLVLAAAKSDGLTPVQLQKSLFLLGQNFKKEVGSKFYHFAPYHYGPFDSSVYTDAELLQQQGFVKIENADKRWPRYFVTLAGQERAARLEKEVSKSLREYIEKVVRWTQGLSFQQLVRSIYRAYPEFKVNSVFRE